VANGSPTFGLKVTPLMLTATPEVPTEVSVTTWLVPPVVVPPTGATGAAGSGGGGLNSGLNGSRLCTPVNVAGTAAAATGLVAAFLVVTFGTECVERGAWKLELRLSLLPPPVKNTK
jgi:hypothetical protein